METIETDYAQDVQLMSVHCVCECNGLLLSTSGCWTLERAIESGGGEEKEEVREEEQGGGGWPLRADTKIG